MFQNGHPTKKTIKWCNFLKSYCRRNFHIYIGLDQVTPNINLNNITPPNKFLLI